MFNVWNWAPVNGIGVLSVAGSVGSTKFWVRLIQSRLRRNKTRLLVHSGAAGSETELNQKQVVSTTDRTIQKTTQKEFCLFYQEVMMIINITGNLKSGINNREWWSWVRSWMLGCLQQSLAPRYGKLGQAVNCCGVFLDFLKCFEFSGVFSRRFPDGTQLPAWFFNFLKIPGIL